MALNVFKTLRLPIQIDYSPTAAGGCTMSKGTSKFKAANGISRNITAGEASISFAQIEQGIAGSGVPAPRVGSKDWIDWKILW